MRILKLRTPPLELLGASANQGDRGDLSVRIGLTARRRELRRTAASIKTYRATCTHLMVRGMLLRWVGRVVMITQMDCVE